MTLVPLNEHNAALRHAQWLEENTGLPLCNIACPKCGEAMVVGLAVSEEVFNGAHNGGYGYGAILPNDCTRVTCPKCWHLDTARKGENGV